MNIASEKSREEKSGKKVGNQKEKKKEKKPYTVQKSFSAVLGQ